MFRLPYLVFLVVSTVSARHVNFYRKDYTYIEDYDAFYKLHWDENGKDFSSTFLACDDEGAELFYPNIINEWVVAKKLVQGMADAPNMTDVFVGIHDKFGLGEYITLDGHPAKLSVQNLGKDSGDRQCVTMDIETGAYTAESCTANPDTVRPYICKKVEETSCPTIDKGYNYIKDTNKCYKVNNNPKTWAKAMETCYMEGGLLLVVESEMESRITIDLLRKFDTNKVFFAGFKQMFPNNDYYTVKGHKIQDSGFNTWYDEHSDDMHKCGAVFNYNNNDRLYLKSRSCDEVLPFICEIGVKA